MSINDVLTNIENNTVRVQAEKATTKMGESTMDQDSFLQLLMMEMKSQDPLNPIKNSEFISQQAQFTSISELQKLNKSVVSSNQFMQASSLIGKEVTLQNPDDPNTSITGAVTEARINPKGAEIVINDKNYPIGLITNIK